MVNILEELGNQKRTLLSGIENLRRWVQYQGWFLRISTLDRRWQLLILLGPLAVILIILIICVSVGTKTDGSVCQIAPGLYRGEYSSTVTGLTCQLWSSLNSSIHTVHPDRFRGSGLGDHNFCRDPDGTGRLWCYTSLTMDHFDYCTTDHCDGDKPERKSQDTRYLPGTDTSCIPEVSAVNQGPQVDGTYRMSDSWVNGRGVYRKISQSKGLPLGAVCISWHAEYRHWWFTLCSNAGVNGGFSWMEEDGKCPYDGASWRAGGSDELKDGASVVPVRQAGESCVEYGVLYDGAVLGTGSRVADDTASCRQYCHQADTCRAFAFSKRESRCRLFQSVQNKTTDVDYVSGSHTCQLKVKVGCPRGSERVKGGCFRFLDSAGHVCEDGCSRFRAMEECELTGGILADSLPEDVIRELLKLSYSTYSYSNWWIAASDFRKKGRFTWEHSDDPVSSQPDLWHMLTTQEILSSNQTDSSTGSTTAATTADSAQSAVVSTADPSVPRGNAQGHKCVYLARFSGEVKLSQINCDTALARPICQYIVQ